MIILAVTNFFVYYQLDYYLLNVYTYGQAVLIETAHNILNPENLLSKLHGCQAAMAFTVVMGRSTIYGAV